MILVLEEHVTPVTCELLIQELTFGFCAVLGESLKAILCWCCYGLAGASIVLGVMMLIAGKLVLGIEAFLLGAVLFVPVGYFFDIQARHKASEHADAPAEAGD